MFTMFINIQILKNEKIDFKRKYLIFVYLLNKCNRSKKQQYRGLKGHANMAYCYSLGIKYNKVIPK